MLSATPFQDDHVDRPGPDATMVTIDPQNFSLRLDGHIGHIDDADVFRFSLTEAAVLTSDFGTVESGYVPSLELLTHDGVFINYTSSGSQFVVPAGDWYLSVSGNPGFQSGNFSINVRLDNHIHNELPDDHVDIWGPEAIPVPVDPSTSTLTFEGFMNHVYDRDFFQFDLEVPMRLSFQWSVPDGPFHGSTTIYDDYGQEVTGDHPWSLELSDSVSLAAGHWFIMISGNPAFPNGDYAVAALLQVLPDSPSPETEPNWPAPCNVTSDPEVIDYPPDVIESNTAIDWIEIRHLDGPWPEHHVDLVIPVDDGFAIELQLVDQSPVPAEPVSLTGNNGPTLADPSTIAWQSVLEATIYEAPLQLIDGQQLRDESHSQRESVASLLMDVPAELPERLNLSPTPVQGTTRSELWIDQLDDVGNTIQTRILDQERIVDTSFILPEQSGRFRNWVHALRNKVGNSDRSPWSDVIESPLTSTHPQSGSSAMSLDNFWNHSDRRELTSLLDV